MLALIKEASSQTGNARLVEIRKGVRFHELITGCGTCGRRSY